MSEVAMWLFPIGLAAVISLFIYLRMQWQWTWGLCLQQSLILLASLIGFMYLYPSPLTGVTAVNEHKAAFWAWFAWALFAIFNIGQRAVLNRFSLDLSLFRVSAAQRLCPLVKMIVWGPPAQFWCDMAAAMQLYHDDKPEEAREVFKRWHDDPRIPRQSKDNLIGYEMLGNVLLANWQKIIELYEQLQRNHNGRSLVVFQMASRAYAELGYFDESLRCLDFGRVSPARLTASTFDTAFMSFFALCGACSEVRKVFSLCTSKRILPDYVRLYWLARCHVSRAQTSEALDLFRQALPVVPEGMSAWKERIEAQIEKQESRLASGQAAQPRVASPDIVARADKIYTRWRLAADLVRPAGSSWALTGLMVVLVIAYLVTNPDQVFLVHSMQSPWERSLTEFHNLCYSLGELSAGKLEQGQWWRLISYMFLHGNTAHLLLNVGALYLFGRAVENIYGVPKFMLLFFGSGVLSGLGQAFLTPNETAIGASGAILGIFGAGMAAMLKLKNVVPSYVRRSELRWMLSVALAQVFFDQLINNIAAATDKSENGVRIASFAHVGGMLAGFVMGMLLPTRNFGATNGPAEHWHTDELEAHNQSAISDVNQPTEPEDLIK